MRIIFTSPAVYDRRFPSVWKRREHRYVGRRPIPDTGLYLGVSYGRLPTIRLQCGRGYLTRRQYIVRVCVAHGFPIFIAITPLSAFHAYNVCVCPSNDRFYALLCYYIICYYYDPIFIFISSSAAATSFSVRLRPHIPVPRTLSVKTIIKLFNVYTHVYKYIYTLIRVRVIMYGKRSRLSIFSF